MGVTVYEEMLSDYQDVYVRIITGNKASIYGYNLETTYQSN